jgi:folate-binding protein YgfZ
VLTNVQYAAELTNKGVIQLSGDERVKYLQGQVTTDVNQLVSNQAMLSCHCDFKGKVWSVFYTLAWQDSILLITHNSAVEKSLAELNKYGVFAKVEITDQTPNWHLAGGAGESFEAAILQLFGELPSEPNQVFSNDNGLVLAIESPNQRYLVLQPNNATKKLDIPLTHNEQIWEIDDIKSGLADIRSNAINEYVPQMLNLQMLDAINFEKGCYMGQEVVARTKYLGRNKRAGYILTADTELQDLTDEQLEYQLGKNWRPGGKILRSGSDRVQTWVFAVLANDTEIGTTFRLKSKPEVLFSTQKLPYTIN